MAPKAFWNEVEEWSESETMESRFVRSSLLQFIKKINELRRKLFFKTIIKYERNIK